MAPGSIGACGDMLEEVAGHGLAAMIDSHLLHHGLSVLDDVGQVQVQECRSPFGMPARRLAVEIALILHKKGGRGGGQVVRSVGAD
jgi:hypothetical protein